MTPRETAGRDLLVSEAACEQLLLSLVQTSANAIYVQDADGLVRSWNPAAERLYGYAATEIVGAPSASLVPPATRKALLESQAQAGLGEFVDHFDTVHLRADGTVVPVSVSIAPILDAAGAVTGIATTAADITVRSRLAAELEELRAELQRQRAALARSSRSLCHSVDVSARVRSLANALLDDSRVRRQPPEPEMVDTGAVLERVLDVLAGPLRSSRGDVLVGPLPPVWTDPHQLESLVHSIIGNALMFTSEGRTLQVCVTADVRDGWVTLVVDDNGRSIEPEHRDRPSMTSRRLHGRQADQGTATGLARARQVVEVDGARVLVEESPLGGARFGCTLPGAART